MSSPWISGAELLLRKMPIYLQCKAQTKYANEEDTLAGFVQGDEPRELKRYGLRGRGDEGNQLLGGPSAYSLLALSRGIQEVLLQEQKESSSLSDEEDERGDALQFLSSAERGKIFRLVDALSRPFDEIHLNMSSISSRQKTLRNQQGSNIQNTLPSSLSTSPMKEVDAVTEQKEHFLLDAALSLPVLVEAVYPSAASRVRTAHSYKPSPVSGHPHSRKRKRSESAEVLNVHFLDDRDENVNKGRKLCRYGSSIIATIYAETRSKECHHILQAIRHPTEEGSAYPGIQMSLRSASDDAGGLRRFRDAHDQRLEPLMEHIINTSSSSVSSHLFSHSSSRQERDDQATLQAYLKRFLWIVNQIRQKRVENSMYDSSTVCWEDMTESERVKAEIKHIIQQRDRFSRTRPSSFQDK